MAAVVECIPGAAPDAEAVRSHARAALARYKVPDVVRFVDAMPRNAMNKIVKPRLRPLFDDVAPVVAAPVPNPTPVGAEAEASSPAGTRVAVNFTCRDNCDQNPVEGDVREVFPFGDSQVQLLCTDESGNESATPVVIRVGDSQGPTVVGQIPDRFEIACNSAKGAQIAVPQVIWADNGTLAQNLVQSLTIDPGPNEQVFAELPDTIVLSVGEHTLRYAATDESNNSSTVAVTVVVTDTGVPRIESRRPTGVWLVWTGCFLLVPCG